MRKFQSGSKVLLEVALHFFIKICEPWKRRCHLPNQVKIVYLKTSKFFHGLFRGCSKVSEKLYFVFALFRTMVGSHDSISSRSATVFNLFAVRFRQRDHVDGPNGILIAAAVLVYVSPRSCVCSLNELNCAVMNSL